MVQIAGYDVHEIAKQNTIQIGSHPMEDAHFVGEGPELDSNSLSHFLYQQYTKIIDSTKGYGNIAGVSMIGISEGKLSGLDVGDCIVCLVKKDPYGNYLNHRILTEPHSLKNEMERLSPACISS